MEDDARCRQTSASLAVIHPLRSGIGSSQAAFTRSRGLDNNTVRGVSGARTTYRTLRLTLESVFLLSSFQCNMCRSSVVNQVVVGERNCTLSRLFIDVAGFAGLRECKYLRGSVAKLTVLQSSRWRPDEALKGR